MKQTRTPRVPSFPRVPDGTAVSRGLLRAKPVMKQSSARRGALGALAIGFPKWPW